MAVFSSAEHRAWHVPERLSPSEWAAKYRILTSSMSAEAGPWRNDRTPYLVGIMDALDETGVEEIVFLKPAQVGFSEASRNMIGWFIDQEPGPTLAVMPSEKSGREMFEERFKPLIKKTPALSRHITSRSDDITLERMTLDTMTLYLAWAGSAQALASRPIRYVLFDEVDKYPPFSGKEADPISLGIKRTTTYGHRARVVVGSTPTTRDGAIWRRWEICTDQRRFHVPCPHCGKHQHLKWSQVKWPKIDEADKARKAASVELGRLAYYECEHCQKRIDDRHKPAMLERGVWSGSDQIVTDDGRVVGTKPNPVRVGFHINALYSPWLTFSKLAGEFILSLGDVGAMMDFRNSRMAEPFEVQAESVKTNAIREKVKVSGPPRVVPDWAGALIATADTQKDHFYYTIRAWGHEYRSALVAHGKAETFDNLKAVCLDATYATESGHQVQPTVLLIDSGGSRTNEVYQFALKDGRIQPLRGASRAMRGVWSMSRVSDVGVTLRVLDTHFFKDMLARLVKEKLDDNDPDSPDKWLTSSACGDDYCHQMASEHKIFDAKKRREVWVPVSQGADNHFWDCEVYQCAGAYMNNVAQIPPMKKSIQQRQQTQQQARRRREAATSRGGGWANGHKGRW
jgi:phage terminase large subunit GpA-like protein